MTPPAAATTPLTRALETIRSLKAQLAEQGGNAPLAVVGAGLRFPGGIDDLDSFWAALEAGRDLVTPRPDHRLAPFAGEWATLPRQAGHLAEILDFDAGFFGISPREAAAIDPQHRLLLEVAWEAMEHAGLPPDRLGDARVGTFVGITGRHDYWDWLPGEVTSHWSTGNGHSFAAGRIAYAMGLTGPAVAIDAACSSSLIAIHQAAQALRRGECEIALAGGVNLIVSPGSTRIINETGALAPDGRCKSFDARANGFTRGEGCGVIVLKKLADARRDGDRVLGVIQGSAVNQDGRSGGFTAPNVLSQITLLRTALADAGLTAADIGLVEAHGTGTSLGDPIEMEAIVEALGRANGGAPLHVGSVKANMGHLEAAAGIAGVLKALLCVERRVVPPLTHFRTLNPRIDLDGTGITLSGEKQGWDTGRSGGFAGVSSFGMSGTNAHVVVGPAESVLDDASTPVPVTGFELSARTPDALRTAAARMGERLAGQGDEVYPAFAYTVTAGRARHAVRAAVRAADRAAAVAALAAIAAGEESAAVTVTDAAPAGDPAPVDLPRAVIDLPAYPWERQRYAPEFATSAAEATVEPPAFHTLAWSPVTPEAAGAALVLAGDDTQVLELLAGAAREAGTACEVAPGVPADADAWAAFWAVREAASPHGGLPVRLVLALRANPLPAEPEAGSRLAENGGALCAAVTFAVRGLERSGVAGTAHVLTRGARRVADGDVVAGGDHGLVQGLAPVLGLEFPGVWGGVADLPAVPDAADAAAALRLVTGAPGEDLAAVRGGVVLAARITVADAADVAPLPVRADASYLVTGGLGVVGRAVAADLVRRGARHLLLVGRTPEAELSAAGAGALAALRGTGAEVTYRAADCDDPVALAAACAVEGLPAVRGVVHAAGSLPHRPLAEATAEDFERALRGKFTGAWWLHLLARAWPLDFLVPVSSVSALWGTEGYGAYAAANGGIDAVAALRAAAGLPGASVEFGPWAGEGSMADDAGRDGLARAGLASIAPASGAAGFGLPRSGDPLLVAADVDWSRLAEVLAVRRRRRLFDAVTTPAPAAGEAPATAPVTAPAARELLALPELARPAAARDRVRVLLAAVLGHADADAVRDDTGFFDLGLDSVMAIDLEVSLAAAFGVPVQVSDVFDHPTVEELAGHLLALVLDAPPPAAEPVAPAAVVAQAPVELPSPEGPLELPAGGGEPIAIVGLAGRFPGADSAEELWRLLIEGRDGVGPVPADRWDGGRLTDADPLRTGTITTDQGGFLSDVGRFDAAFFDIPAREAESLDPQHRLVLEAAWHALEDSGTDPKSLRGSRTGVWLGISNSDYARLLERGGLDGLDAYFSTGTALNAAAGRIAYLLGLNGPALAIDTACSSSLVALHLAIRSLRSGETDRALAAGVNVIAAPSCSVAVSRAHMLSPDGRCKVFSAEADGFVRAEGCGVLVLKRLSDARRDGDTVLAVLHGSAINQDGASSGLTAPSGRAQEAVIGAALADAGLAGADLSYLEAHGTGTSLGDPVELRAAWAALGPDRRPGDPLLVGSVKSNIGHSESASGMASVIKTVLALRNERIPANLHCDSLNPQVAWRDMNLRVVDAATPWRSGDRPRYAGVSGFGFSGTNAHVIIGEAPAPAPRPAPADGPFLLPLSAPDAEGLERVTAAWSERLAEAADGEVPGLVATAGAGRAHLAVRRAVTGRSREELLAALGKATAGHSSAGGREPRVAFLFSGQGSQHFGMGRELYATEPVFRDVIDACDAIIAPQLGLSLTALMFDGEERDLINQTRYTQPALVALELALAALWESWGVTATAVVGHSVGEIAAAIHAGVLGLADGLTLITHRARLMQSTRPGGMLAVTATLEQVTDLLEGTGLDVAAVNGPQAVVVAGEKEALDALAARCKELKYAARPLVVSHAFHSALMEPVLPELDAIAAGFTHSAPRIPIVANVTGRMADAGTYEPGYWSRHVRRPVRFHDGVAQLTDSVEVFLEIGPDRTLGHLATAAGAAPAGGTLASLRRGGKDRQVIQAAGAGLYEQGARLNWAAVNAHLGAPRADAPRYPFATTTYWTRAGGAPAQAGGVPSVAADTKHWGAPLRSPAISGQAFAFPRHSGFPAYLTDHRLYGTVVTPAASHLGTMLSALAGQGRPFGVEDLICPRALVIKDGEVFDAQITVDDGGHLAVDSLIDADAGRWERHLSARVVTPGEGRPDPVDREEFTAEADRYISGEAFYRYFRELGYTLGPSFRWIAEVWIRGDEALVRYEMPQLPDDVGEYEIYPGLIDSCFQSIAGFMVDDVADEAPSLAIPFAAGRLLFPGRPDGGELWGHVRVTRSEALARGRLRVETADLHMFTGDGGSVMIADGFRVRHAPKSVLESSLRGALPHAYAPGWTELPIPDGEFTARDIAVLGDDDGLADALRALGHRVAPATGPDAIAAGTGLVLDARPLARTGDAGAALASVLELAGSLAAAPHGVPYAVLCAAGPEAAEVRESLWGALASLEAEDAERRVVRVTVETGATGATGDEDGHAWASALAAALSAGLEAGLPERRLAAGPGGVRAARLTAIADAPAVPAWRGSTLITGGLGALGLSTARQLAAQGAQAITLMARSAPGGTARAALEALEADGVKVTVVAGDVTDPADCARAVAAAETTAPLRAVLHLAGTTADGAFTGLEPAAYEAVFAAKALGARNLAAAVDGRELDAFVLYSSVSSVLGSAGQVNYAAANGYLNGLAARLRAAGVPATSVAWGPWIPEGAGGGLAASAAVERATARLGVRALTDEEAAPLLTLAVAGGRRQLVAVHLDPVRYAEHLAGHPRGALLAALAPQAPAAGAEPAAVRPVGWLREALTQLPAAERGDELGDMLEELVGDLLGEPGAVDRTAGFADLGLDSIMVIDLRGRLAHALDTELPATIAIDHPSIPAMVRHLTGELFPAPAPAPITIPAPITPAADDADPGELSLEELIQAVRDDLEA